VNESEKRSRGSHCHINTTSSSDCVRYSIQTRGDASLLRVDRFVRRDSEVARIEQHQVHTRGTCWQHNVPAVPSLRPTPLLCRLGRPVCRAKLHRLRYRGSHSPYAVAIPTVLPPLPQPVASHYTDCATAAPTARSHSLYRMRCRGSHSP
jgi:hypothetical protein